jgi:UDP-glucuronate decarboxylase
MKKILITGGNGFIGSNLTKLLLKSGHHVTVIDNFYSSKENYVQYPNLSFINHDIVNRIPDIKCDLIFHLACPASPKVYLRDTLYTLDVNYLGTKNILDFAKHESTPIVFSSTSEIYGDPEISPQNEKYTGNVYPPSLRSSYDEGKRVAETLMYNYHINHRVPIQIVRLFNTYGPKMDPEDGRVVSNFIMQGINKEPMSIYGNGSQTRSLCYIDDITSALYKLIIKWPTYEAPINLGNDKEMKIIDIADFISESLNIEKNYIYKELPEHDPKTRKPDNSKAKELLDWEPKFSLKTGIEKTIEYFKELN